jgi:DNA invertase Pin-like site-specific DNA recombinase
VVDADAPAAPPHLIGYARVSMIDQDPRLQIDALIKAGVDPRDIYQEKVSGAAANRPMFKAMMKEVRAGDVVLVWKLDRLGRSNIGLHETAEEITARGAFLKVIINPELDTNTPLGRLMFGMLAIFAQFERDQIRERSAAGLKAARERGHIGGRPPKMTEDQVKAAIRRNDKGEHLSDIAVEYGVSRNGLYKRALEMRRRKEAKL